MIRELVLKSNNEESLAKIIALAKELNVVVEKKIADFDSTDRGILIYLYLKEWLYRMENIIVEKVALKDINQLQKVSKQTFLQAYSALNSEENMAIYLEEGFSLERLTAELNNEHSAFYFALLDKNIIGYLKLNFGKSQTELKDDKALEIERIYVLQEFYGKKVGQLLYEKAIQVAEQINADYVWLGVWEENLRAIRFYKKNGFEEFDKHIFKLGDDEQMDIMMRKKMGAGC